MSKYCANYCFICIFHVRETAAVHCRFIKWFIQYSIFRRMDLFRYSFPVPYIIYMLVASVNYSIKYSFYRAFCCHNKVFFIE